MKMPAPMMPPITAMVVPKRPRWRARPLTGDPRSLEFSGAVTILRSTRLRQFVEIFDVRERGAIHALNFRVFRFDDVVLVGGVRTVSMTEAEVASGKTQRVASEYVTGPGAGEARKNHRINSVFLVNAGGRANDRGIGRRGSGVVAASHVHIDVAETFFRQMRFQRGESFGGSHVGNEAEVKFRNGFAGKNRLATGARVAANVAFNFPRCTRNEELERFLPAHVAHPALHAQ